MIFFSCVKEMDIVFPRLVSPPNEGDRNVNQQYPISAGVPYISTGVIRNSTINANTPACTTGQWYTTLPQSYPRSRTMTGPTTIKHIYGTVCYDEKGTPTVCKTGVNQNHEAYDYMYSWVPVDTASYDSSAPLGPNCCPEPISSGACIRSNPATYRLGQYRNPEEAFRTAGTLLWPANGRQVREPHIYTNYGWSDGRGRTLTTNVHPKTDPMAPPINRI